MKLHKILLVSRDRDEALHDCEEQKKIPLVFCNYKYNKQTKVIEILASPYERQRTHTDVFPNPLLCHTNAKSLLHHTQIIYRLTDMQKDT